MPQKNYFAASSRSATWLSLPGFFVVCLLTHSFVNADETAAISAEDIFFSEIPVVLSATRLKQPRTDAPAAITIIDHELIEASGATEIVDLFRLVPGFQIGHDSNDLLVSDPVGATYHGLSDPYSRRTQVLVDGRSIYDPAIGGVRWNELPLDLDDIEHIEVIRGPNAVTYGANSFLAVINIVTRHPSDVADTSVKVVAGTESYKKGIYRYAREEDKSSYRITLGYRGDDGLADFHDNRETRFAYVRGEYKSSATDTYGYQLGLGNGAHQAGAVGDPGSPARTTFNDNNFQQLQWTRDVSSNEQYRLQYYRNYSNYKDSFIASVFAPSDTPIDQSMQTERNNIEFQHIRRWHENLRTVLGAEARVDEARAPNGWFYGIDKIHSNLYRAFGNAEWRINDSWLANTGIMAEYNELTGVGFSPRIALNYKIAPEQTVRVSASQGLRTPSLFEDQANARADTSLGPYYSFVSDGNIAPEKITSYEIGYLTKSHDSRLLADVRLFQDSITDLIVYPGNNNPPAVPPFGPLYRYENSGNATIKGVEIELAYRPTKHSHILLSYAYADQTGWYKRYYNPDVIRPTDLATPHNTVALLGIRHFPRDISASIGIYYTDEMGWFENITRNPEFTRVDIRLAKKFHTAAYAGTVELVGQNLAGPYYDYTPTVVMDRRIFVKLRVQSH